MAGFGVSGVELLGSSVSELVS
jgi:hypothetical protein